MNASKLSSLSGGQSSIKNSNLQSLIMAEKIIDIYKGTLPIFRPKCNPLPERKEAKNLNTYNVYLNMKKYFNFLRTVLHLVGVSLIFLTKPSWCIKNPDIDVMAPLLSSSLLTISQPAL